MPESKIISPPTLKNKQKKKNLGNLNKIKNVNLFCLLKKKKKLNL